MEPEPEPVVFDPLEPEPVVFDPLEPEPVFKKLGAGAGPKKPGAGAAKYVRLRLLKVKSRRILNLYIFMFLS